MALAISCMRSLPAGRFAIHLLIITPYNTAKIAAPMTIIIATDMTSPYLNFYKIRLADKSK